MGVPLKIEHDRCERPPAAVSVSQGKLNRGRFEGTTSQSEENVYSKNEFDHGGTITVSTVAIRGRLASCCDDLRVEPTAQLPESSTSLASAAMQVRKCACDL